MGAPSRSSTVTSSPTTYSWITWRIRRSLTLGIAKLLNNQQVHYTITKIMGTKGYAAPEWFVEIICCGRLPPDNQRIGTMVPLLNWVESLIEDGRMSEVSTRGGRRERAGAPMVLGSSMADSAERYARVAYMVHTGGPIYEANNTRGGAHAHGCCPSASLI
uniref:Uncharacterized protein n=1 Tax=Oryza glaberrima TaxID=4538 RepID=I1QDZ4_ORYGL